MENNIKILIEKYTGDECTEETYIDQLEALIEKANAYAREGKELFPDAIYDTLTAFLGSVKPDSTILHQVWSGDDETVDYDEDIDRYLSSTPMLSIQTIKDIDDAPVDRFIAALPKDRSTRMHLSLKENGHGIRICVAFGMIVKATSRGRSTNGRDLTRQVKLILGEEISGLSDICLCELRGEVLLPYSNLDRAKDFNPDIKSAFSGVSSMLRDSATEEETKLLKFVGYDIITDELEFSTLDQKFEYIRSLGIETPITAIAEVTPENFKTEIPNYLAMLAEADIVKNYDYYTDGVVAAVDNIADFQAMGSEDKFRLGNLAFKIGRWEQNVYAGRVREIKWKPGKNKLSPVCVVEDPDTGELGVLTGTGNTVKNVPIYAPKHILAIEAYVGNIIHFKYGGEAGVVPCTPTGVLLTDPALKVANSNAVDAFVNDEDADLDIMLGDD